MVLLIGKDRFQIAFRLLAACLSSIAWIGMYSIAVGQDVSKPAIREKPAVEDSIATLVSRLESSEFATRESAMNLLAQLDEKRLPELELALKGIKPDELEAKIRVTSLITRIKSERMQKQTRSFLRSVDPDQTFGFEGWTSFSKYSTTGRNAKTIFLKMIETYPELVFTKLASKQEAIDKARKIATDISQKRMLEGYEEGDALALLYCLNVADDMTDRRLESLSVSTFRTSPFSQFMLDPQARKALEPLIAGWSKRIEERKLECLLMLVERDYPQSKEVAVRLLESEGLDSFGYVRAMQCLFRFGNANDLPILEKWLDDKTIYATKPVQASGNENGLDYLTAEHRDIALLVAMHLSGGDYSGDFPRLESLSLWGFREDSLMLPAKSNEVRDNRIKKWREKRAAGK